MIVVLAEVGPTAALVVLIEIVYQQIENYFLSPKISSKTIELNAGVAFGAAMAGGAVGGFVGAFFALPSRPRSSRSCRSTRRPTRWRRSELTRVDEPPPEPPEEEKRGLRERLRRRKPDEPVTGAFDDRSETS